MKQGLICASCNDLGRFENPIRHSFHPQTSFFSHIAALAQGGKGRVRTGAKTRKTLRERLWRCVAAPPWYPIKTATRLGVVPLYDTGWDDLSRRLRHFLPPYEAKNGPKRTFLGRFPFTAPRYGTHISKGWLCPSPPVAWVTK